MKIAMPNGCGIHVESQGHGEPAIIFLHGIMMSGAVFKHQIGALAGDHRVITMISAALVSPTSRKPAIPGRISSQT